MVDSEASIIDIKSKEWTGPKHAKEPTANPKIESLKHRARYFIEGATTQDKSLRSYEATLNSINPFKMSHILREATPYIKSGDFETGVTKVMELINNRFIDLEFVPEEEIETPARVLKKDHSVMILPDNFKNLPHEMQLWELLQRNMLLIHQRLGANTQINPDVRNDLYRMGTAYANSLGRLSARSRNFKNTSLIDSAKKIKEKALEFKPMEEAA